MKQLIGIVLFLLSFHMDAFAEDLEVKVNQKSIKLPYWPAQTPHYGGVILVNGGVPAQWSESLSHLAKILSLNGWSTVLLNASPEVTVPWLTQVPEVISALRQDKNRRIVLIHYGEQLNMTLDYFSKPQGKAINGLVLLSAYDDKSSTVKPESLHFPIFDIDGQFDYDEVKSQFIERNKSFRSPTYFSMEFPGANHGYDYAQELLVSFLTGWMLKIPKTAVSAPPINVKSLVQS